MEKEGGNRERMRKCRESISLHFLIFSPFPPHFLILSPFPRSPAARLQRFVQPCLAISIAAGDDEHGDYSDYKAWPSDDYDEDTMYDPLASENERLAGTIKSVMMRTTIMMMRKTQYMDLRTKGWQERQRW